MIGRAAPPGEPCSQHLSASWASFGIFPLCAHIPCFQISYYSFCIILASATSSCFTLAVPMRDLSCVGYTLCAWDPRSLSSIQSLYFGAITLELKLCYRSTDQVDHLTYGSVTFGYFYYQGFNNISVFKYCSYVNLLSEIFFVQYTHLYLVFTKNSLRYIVITPYAIGKKTITQYFRIPKVQRVGEKLFPYCASSSQALEQ